MTTQSKKEVSNATNRPWINKGGIYIVDKNTDESIAKCFPIPALSIKKSEENIDRAEANALLIVKCVNSFDELVATVKDLLKEVKISLGHAEQEEKNIIEARIKWAEEVLQKAGEL